MEGVVRAFGGAATRAAPMRAACSVNASRDGGLPLHRRPANREAGHVNSFSGLLHVRQYACDQGLAPVGVGETLRLGAREEFADALLVHREVAGGRAPAARQ